MEIEQNPFTLEYSDNYFHTDYPFQNLSRNPSFKSWYKEKNLLVKQTPNSYIIYCPLCYTYYIKIFGYRDVSNQCPFCHKRFCMGCNRENLYGNNCLKARIKYSIIYTNFNDYSQFFFGINSYYVFFIFCIICMPLFIS